MDVVSSYTNEFLEQTYRLVCISEPFSTKYIRRMQEEFTKRNIEIPVIYCGYRGENGMEFHPDYTKNNEARELYNKRL